LDVSFKAAVLEKWKWVECGIKREVGMSGKDSMKHLTDANFETEVKKGVTLVDFHANWCGPCRMLAPVLEQVAKEIGGKATIGKVDIDSEQGIASRFQIASVPTMILFKDGKEVNRLVGLRNAEAIKDFIMKAM
jgi:thioredoxin 1